MTSAEIDKMIEEYHQAESEKRNRELRARLARPASREELFARLASLALPRAEEGAILLTKSSKPFIMETAR